MALNNIKIIVIDGGKQGTYTYKNAGLANKQNLGENKESALYKVTHIKETIHDKITGKMSPTTAMAYNMGLQIAKQFASQTANYYISDIGRKNGDSNYQQLVNSKIQQISDWGSIISDTLSSAAIGATAGPVGAAIGAVAGLTMSLINLGYKESEKARVYQQTMFEQNNKQAYNLARANYSVHTGRVR